MKTVENMSQKYATDVYKDKHGHRERWFLIRIDLAVVKIWQVVNCSVFVINNCCKCVNYVDKF